MEGGGGVPPFPLRKNPLKIGPKTVFLGKNRRFRRKNFRFRKRTVRGGRGGVPPFSVNFFSANFSENSRPWRLRGGGPPQRKVSVPGVFETFPNQQHTFTTQDGKEVPSRRLERKEVHQPWTLGSQILPNISFPRLSQILSSTPDITVQIQVILSSHLIL